MEGASSREFTADGSSPRKVDGGWILLGEFTPPRAEWARRPRFLCGASGITPGWSDRWPLPRLSRLPSSVLPQSWNLTALASASGVPAVILVTGGDLAGLCQTG